MLTGQRPGVVDWSGGVFASCCCGSNCTLALAMDGRISAAAPLALANQLPLPMNVKHSWSGFSVSCAIEESLALALAFSLKRMKSVLIMHNTFKSNIAC